MSLTVSNNSAVASASYHLGKNQKALQHSIKKLASGKKIISSNEDPGTLSVAMKLNAAVTRLVGAKNNVQNGISFMEVQDGMLETVGRMVNRMAELKGMATQDPMKSDQDIESYNNEFHDLQQQLFQISQQTFNGSSLFARYVERDSSPAVGNETLFRGTDQQDHTISIFTSDNGSAGTKISIHRATLLGALTVEAGDLERADNTRDAFFGTATGTAAGTRYINNNTTDQAVTGQIISFAAEDSTQVWDLDAVSMGFFEQALSNIAFLRAQSGGSMSRLQFAAESIAAYETNMRAALGRIEDVDIAEESANLAKYSILTQASAAMVAQANSTNDVALMLLR
jgi:flagellin